ncbi:MAG: PDZ domain-containing protein, partial [Campylobacteraceae bacterium]|nr:PDZ domain-containing protein [Campylobacteraceae bacterium]
PADKAALKRGDKILKIDGKTLKQMNLKDVAQELRGAANTKVKLTILKKNSKNQIDMLLTRKMMDTDLITSKMLHGNIAHLKINSFSQNSLHEMIDDLEFIAAQNYGKLNGMVLDLRDNPGGALTSGIAIASLFLPSDAVIINVESRQKEDKRQYKNTLSDYDGAEYASRLTAMQFLKTIPLVIIVNGDSAGSSEIVASSLQEHDRALVVGVSTLGKDTFATIFPLTSKPSAIKLATARWTTPKGKSVWPNGVIPNVEVIGEIDEEDAPLVEALKILSKK